MLRIIACAVPRILKSNRIVLLSQTDRITHIYQLKKLLCQRRFISIESATRGGDSVQGELETPYNDICYDEIAEGDPEIERLLKVLILEVDILRQDGELVPDKIKSSEWRELLTLQSKSSRLRYLKFLFKNERKQENRKSKTLERTRLRKEEEEKAVESGHIIYGFRGSTMFVRIYDSTMDSYLNKNLINAAMFSQHLIFDCSYDRYMTNMEARNCAKQICMLFSDNRNHAEPFHIQFCNVNPNSTAMQALNRYIPTMYDKSFPFFTTTQSYLDLYPKERLVYLTPHCKEHLEEYSHDDIYIVGAMVDKSNPKPFSMAKAKEQGLRMARLPLEKHLIWASGSTKNLTLNQMTSILLDVRHTNNWEYAFRHIPRRKVIDPSEIEMSEARPIRKVRPAIQALLGSKDILLSENVISRIRNKDRR